MIYYESIEENQRCGNIDETDIYIIKKCASFTIYKAAECFISYFLFDILSRKEMKNEYTNIRP